MDKKLYNKHASLIKIAKQMIKLACLNFNDILKTCGPREFILWGIYLSNNELKNKFVEADNEWTEKYG